MAAILRKAWIIDTILQQKKNPSRSIVQVLEVFENNVWMTVSDKWHTIGASITENCVKQFNSEHPKKDFASIRGLIVTLEEYEIRNSNNKFYFLVNKIKITCAEPALRIGDPKQVNEDKRVKGLLQKLTSSQTSNQQQQATSGNGSTSGNQATTLQGPDTATSNAQATKPSSSSSGVSSIDEGECFISPSQQQLLEQIPGFSQEAKDTGPGFTFSQIDEDEEYSQRQRPKDASQESDGGTNAGSGEAVVSSPDSLGGANFVFNSQFNDECTLNLNAIDETLVLSSGIKSGSSDQSKPLSDTSINALRISQLSSSSSASVATTATDQCYGVQYLNDFYRGQQRMEVADIEEEAENNEMGITLTQQESREEPSNVNRYSSLGSDEDAIQASADHLEAAAATGGMIPANKSSRQGSSAPRSSSSSNGSDNKAQSKCQDISAPQPAASPEFGASSPRASQQPSPELVLTQPSPSISSSSSKKKGKKKASTSSPLLFSTQPGTPSLSTSSGTSIHPYQDSMSAPTQASIGIPLTQPSPGSAFMDENSDNEFDVLTQKPQFDSDETRLQSDDDEREYGEDSNHAKRLYGLASQFDPLHTQNTQPDNSTQCEEELVEILLMDDDSEEDDDHIVKSIIENLKNNPPITTTTSANKPAAATAALTTPQQPRKSIMKPPQQKPTKMTVTGNQSRRRVVRLVDVTMRVASPAATTHNDSNKNDKKNTTNAVPSKPTTTTTTTTTTEASAPASAQAVATVASTSASASSKKRSGSPMATPGDDKESENNQSAKTEEGPQQKKPKAAAASTTPTMPASASARATTSTNSKNCKAKQASIKSTSSAKEATKGKQKQPALLESAAIVQALKQNNNSSSSSSSKAQTKSNNGNKSRAASSSGKGGGADHDSDDDSDDEDLSYLDNLNPVQKIQNYFGDKYSGGLLFKYLKRMYEPDE